MRFITELWMPRKFINFSHEWSTSLSSWLSGVSHKTTGQVRVTPVFTALQRVWILTSFHNSFQCLIGFSICEKLLPTKVVFARKGNKGQMRSSHLNDQVQPHERELTGTLECIFVGGVGKEIGICTFPARRKCFCVVLIKLANASVVGDKQGSGSCRCTVSNNGIQQVCNWSPSILDPWEGYKAGKYLKTAVTSHYSLVTSALHPIKRNMETYNWQ